MRLETIETSFQQAQAMGAVALFGEKYGERVRVVKVGDFSLELCGGTHLKETGELGLFKIISESSVASGVRRIEAVAERAAQEYFKGELAHYVDHNQNLWQKCHGLETTLIQLGGSSLLDDALLITTPEKETLTTAIHRSDLSTIVAQFKDFEKKNAVLLEKYKQLQKKLADLEASQAIKKADALLGEVRNIKGIKVISASLTGYSSAALRRAADQLRDKLKSGIVVLASVTEGRIALIAAVTEDLVKRGFNAGGLIKEVAKIVNGGGGGRPSIAEAGGKDISKLDEALAKVFQIIDAHSGN